MGIMLNVHIYIYIYRAKRAYKCTYIRTGTGLERDEAIEISNPLRGRAYNVSVEFRIRVRCSTRVYNIMYVGTITLWGILLEPFTQKLRVHIIIHKDSRMYVKLLYKISRVQDFRRVVH